MDLGAVCPGELTALGVDTPPRLNRVRGGSRSGATRVGGARGARGRDVALAIRGELAPREVDTHLVRAVS